MNDARQWVIKQERFDIDGNGTHFELVQVADGKNICEDCESVLVRWT